MKDQLSQITPVQAVVFSALIVGVYWMIFYNDGKKEQSKLTAAQSSFTEKTKELEKLNQSIRDAQKYEKLNSKLSKQLEKIADAIPEKATLHRGTNEKRELERMLSQEVRDIGAELKSVSAGSWVESNKNSKNKNIEKLDGKFEQIDLNVNIECSFQRVMVFLSNLTKKSRIFTIDSVNISPQGDGSQLKKNEPLRVSFSLKMKTYRYLVKEKKAGAS